MTGPAWVTLPAARHGGDTPAGGHWARVGDEVVVWAPDGDEAALGERTGVAGRRASGLALVVQVGRSFQDEHPDVPVVLDHGRHLVVDVGAAGPPAGGGTCWRIGPLPEDTVVVDRPEPAPARRDAATLELLDRLSVQACEADLVHLVGLGTRHSLGQGFRDAAAWAAARLASLGYATAQPAITVGAGQSRNVVADRPGTGPGGRGLVVVTAHLDSVNLADGPAAPAPGADDNGSGSAGLLELARVLAGRRWEQDVRLILFGGEEQGLLGSRQYVAGLPADERGRIRAVLNMDMIGRRNTVQPAVLLEGAPVSSGQVDGLAAAAATYTGLQVETSLSPFASDHVPFLDAGIPAVLTIEGADGANGDIHSARDVLDHIDLALVREILRMNLAALAGWLGPVAASTGSGAPT